MDQHNVAEIISLVLTTPTVFLAAAVFIVWWRAAADSFRREERESIHWFILGVFISFVGQFLDNIYWGIAWSLSFTDSEFREDYFQNGVYYNIFARQMCGCLAAFFHLLAAIKTGRQYLRLLYFFCFSLTVGAVGVFALQLLK